MSIILSILIICVTTDYLHIMGLIEKENNSSNDSNDIIGVNGNKNNSKANETIVNIMKRSITINNGMGANGCVQQ